MAVVTPTFTNITGTPVTPQFVEYVVKGHAVESDGGSKPFVNIFHFARMSGPGTGTEAEFYGAVAVNIDAAAMAALSVTYLPDETTVRFMDDPTRAAVSNANAWVGAVTGDRLPTFNSVVIQKLTFARGRSYRGSTHYGPIAESQTLLDNLTAGAQTLWGDLADAFALMLLSAGGVGTPDGSQWAPIVLSPTLSDLGASPIVVTGSFCKEFKVNKRLGTMKRRKDRTGPST